MVGAESTRRERKRLGLPNKIVVLMNLIRSLFACLSLCLIVQLACAEDSAYEKLTSISMKKLLFQTEIHDKTWGISRAAKSNLDQDTGTITWTFADGQIVEAPVQVIGTYNRTDNSFLWSWANPSVVSALHINALLARSYGEKHGVKDLASPLAHVSEEQAWEFAAIANHLSKSSGAYRAGAGGPIVYVTFGKINLRNVEP
jgi:hypothetical protein